jgi:hypothetical protein
MFICCHMHFEIELDPTRKARFMAGGHMTNSPPYQALLHGIVRPAFLIAALNDLEIMTADIGDAYSNATTKEKVHTICRPEFRQHYKELQQYTRLYMV